MNAMNKFSQKSLDRLKGVEPELQELAHHVLRIHDCTVITGHRTEAEQQKAFDEKKSKVQYPNSKHNTYPSRAIDLSPFPIDWENTKRFYYFAGIVMGVADALGLHIRWGGDWDSDNDLDDQKFMDLVHFELVI